MIPYWSPVQPWLPAGVPLAFNLWPPALQNSPQSHQLNEASGERILRMLSTGVSSEYRCHTCSLRCRHRCPILWYLQQTESKKCLSCFECVSEFACHSPICPDAPGLKRGSCCSVMESCLLQKDPVTWVPCFHHYWRNMCPLWAVMSTAEAFHALCFYPEMASS